MNSISQQTMRALKHLLEYKQLAEDQILVVGCSTSEISGQTIGSAGSLVIAEAVWQALAECQEHHKFQLAFQCCEHLNRSLVVEAETAKALEHLIGCQKVHAVPVLAAGGALATTAWQKMQKPTLIAAVRAQAGIDIGETMIGMHLQAVAVPLRYKEPYIGNARVLLASTRAPLIGGARAVYTSIQ